MKRKFLVATALAGVLTSGAFFAQTGYAAHEHDAAPQAAPGQAAAPMGPGMMMGQGGMMGMMGGQGGMGGGMMGGGMGMMDGMMGKGMGCGMMGGGMGMMDGMMSPGMMGTMTPEEQQKYLDATKDLRKKLHDKRFEYGEAARNPKASKADLLKKKKELWDLQHKIHEKAWEFMKE